MFWVYKDPTGETVFSANQTSVPPTTKISMGTVDANNDSNDIVDNVILNDKQKITLLVQKLKKMERQLEKVIVLSFYSVKFISYIGCETQPK